MHHESRRALDDIDLAAMIAAALQWNTPATGITVEVTNGAVTLEGQADSEQQRMGAETIARRFCADVTNAVQLSGANPQTVGESPADQPVLE